MAKYEPRKTTIDSKTWWVPFNLTTKRYSTLAILGKYRTQKGCAAAIKFYERCYGGI